MGINFDKSHEPTHTDNSSQSWAANEIDTIHIGSMLAKVVIVPKNTDNVTLRLLKGDEALFEKLKATVRDGMLSLECELPYKIATPDAKKSGGLFRSRRRGIFVDNGNVIIGGTTSSLSVNGLSVQIGSVDGRGSLLIINGREVDLSKRLEIELTVPIRTNINVTALIGKLIVTHDLDARMRLTIDSAVTIKTQMIAKLVGLLKSQGEVVIGGVTGNCDFEISGQGKGTIGAVNGDATIELSGQGDCELASVAGKLDTHVSGQGSIDIQGGHTALMKARVSGQGSIRHRGTIEGDASLRVSGMGDIKVSRVRGEVEHRVTGLGEVVANGRRYER